MFGLHYFSHSQEECRLCLHDIEEDCLQITFFLKAQKACEHAESMRNNDFVQ